MEVDLGTDYLTITFDKYMKPETVNNVSVGGVKLGTAEYDKTQTDLAGNNFANKYTFKLESALETGTEYEVSVKGAASYANKTMADYSVKHKTPGEAKPKILIKEVNTADKSVSVYYHNNTGSDMTFMTLCAIYDASGALVEMQTCDMSTFKHTEKTTKVFDFTQEWASYKVFEWEIVSNQNLPLVSKSVPAVADAKLSADTLLITFDKFMKPETVTDVTVDGVALGTPTYNATQKDLNGKVYANEFRFALSTPLVEFTKHNVVIQGAQAYDDTEMQSYSAALNTLPPSLAKELIRNKITPNKANKTIEVEYYNNTEKEYSYNAWCAIYDASGALIEMRSLTFEDLQYEETAKDTFRFTKDWASFRIFEWDFNLKPLLKPYTPTAA